MWCSIYLGSSVGLNPKGEAGKYCLILTLIILTGGLGISQDLMVPDREQLTLELINLRASTLSGGEIRDLRAYYVNNSGSYIVV